MVKWNGYMLCLRHNIRKSLIHLSDLLEWHFRSTRVILVAQLATETIHYSHLIAYIGLHNLLSCMLKWKYLRNCNKHQTHFQAYLKAFLSNTPRVLSQKQNKIINLGGTYNIRTKFGLKSTHQKREAEFTICFKHQSACRIQWNDCILSRKSILLCNRMTCNLPLENKEDEWPVYWLV